MACELCISKMLSDDLSHQQIKMTSIHTMYMFIMYICLEKTVIYFPQLVKVNTHLEWLVAINQVFVEISTHSKYLLLNIFHTFTVCSANFMIRVFISCICPKLVISCLVSIRVLRICLEIKE